MLGHETFGTLIRLCQYLRWPFGLMVNVYLETIGKKTNVVSVKAVKQNNKNGSSKTPSVKSSRHRDVLIERH